VIEIEYFSNNNHNKNQIFLSNYITQAANIPYPLYLSLQGKYFVGYADNMEFGEENVAWAGLINPINSGVKLFVFVWTVSNTGKFPLKADIWFNTYPPGNPVKSELVTPANTAFRPLPKTGIKLLQANEVNGIPSGGAKAFTRKVDTEVTIASDESGKFIFPPGGSFIIVLSAQTQNQNGAGRVAFGWSEEKINENECKIREELLNGKHK
jgi:hypothetical protein